MKPAAKEGDKITAQDTHLANGAPVQVPFQGTIDSNLSPNVLIEKKWAAMVDSTANNIPHLPPPGKSFDKPPSNQGVVIVGAATVLINDRQAARNEDTAKTCNDPTDLPVGRVEAESTVLVGA